MRAKRESKMKTKSTFQSFTQGSVMYEIVLFDCTASPSSHQKGHSVWTGECSIYRLH